MAAQAPLLPRPQHPRRGKLLLSVRQVAAALGLPDDIRIVRMHVSPDPDTLQVTVEGPGIPEGPHDWPGAPALSELAARGDFEAPILHRRFGWHGPDRTGS